MSERYTIEQTPWMGLFITATLIAIGELGLVFFVGMSSGPVFYYGALLFFLLFLITGMFYPSMHAANLLSAIPELEGRDDLSDLEKAYKVRHPWFWLIVPVNCMWLVLVVWFEYNDMNAGNSGYWLYYGSILVPPVVSALMAYSTVKVKLPDAIQQLIAESHSTSPEN